MDYRLFYAKGSASDGVRVILQEIGVNLFLIIYKYSLYSVSYNQ